MSGDRETPFGLVFGAIAPERFPPVARALQRAERSSADRDAFVLLEPVARLLEELAPEDASPDEVEAHLRLLHHAYRHWTAGGWVYGISPALLRRAVAERRISSHLPRQALYLQLPAGRVWRPTGGDAPPEPLDGMFVTETAERGAMAVLGVFGMHRGRPGFSAVGVEGRVDEDDAGTGELELAAARAEGGAAFAPLLGGAAAAGVYSLANAGELLLLTCRLLALLPVARAEEEGGQMETGNGAWRERFVVM
jgi:hypothetical protein